LSTPTRPVLKVASNAVPFGAGDEEEDHRFATPYDDMAPLEIVSV
jgi:hypothetical protein